MQLAVGEQTIGVADHHCARRSRMILEHSAPAKKSAIEMRLQFLRSPVRAITVDTLSRKLRM